MPSQKRRLLAYVSSSRMDFFAPNVAAMRKNIRIRMLCTPEWLKRMKHKNAESRTGARKYVRPKVQTYWKNRKREQ